MAADGTVNIDVILDASQAKGQADDINKMFDDIGDKASSTYKGIVDQYGRPLKMDADTDDADRKVKKLGETYASIPKDLRTKLVADAEDHGIKNMDELLKKMPKELRTELVAKAQKGEVIDYEALLKRLPAKQLTDVQLNDHASPALRHIQAEASRTGEQFTSLKDIIRGSFAGNLLASGAQSIMGYLTGIAHEAITTSDAMDKFKMTMKLGGFGNAEIARSSKEVKKYADETVYDLGDITSTSSQLASNGIKNYQRLTEAAGNLNAQAGGTKDTFKSVALVMTQTAGAGKLTTENWNQMADAMPGASGVLQQEMKKNGAYTGNFRDAMANGQITAEEFFQAIEKLGTTKGAEEAAKSTETFEGAVGNLEAQIITSMDDVIDKMGKKRITNMINGATSAVAGLTTGLMNVFAFMSEHTTVAKTLLGLMVSIFATKRVAEFIGILGEAKKVLYEFGLQEAITKAMGGGQAPAGGNIPTNSAPTGGKIPAGGVPSGGGMAWLRRGVPVATAAVGVGTELLSNNNTGEKIGGSAGSIAGTALGAFAGSFLDPIMGPAGTAIGSMAGGWLGKKIGEAAGNAANKEMAGHSIVAHTKVKIDTDTSGQSRAIRPDLNQVARTVIKMDVDSKSIAQTKTKTDKLYSDMSKSLKKYYDDKEKRSQKDLQQLVKEGAITQQQANRKLKAERDADKRRIKDQQSALNTMQKHTNDHYKRLENIENGSNKKLLQIAQKYGQNSKKYNQERIKELEKENKRYSKQLVKDQMSSDRSIQASIKKGASQQEKIYKDLIKRKGKLSQQDLKQTQRDADKQYKATVRPAQKAKDEVIKNANEKYSQTTKTAKKEWKENGTISGKQYREIKRNADRQRDDTINAAKDQYNGVTKQAREQHKKVTSEINKQKEEVVNAANTQATSHGAAAGQEYTLVNANVQSGQKKTAGIMNGFHKSVNNILKALSASQSIPMIGYATGTGALAKDQLAMVGEEGFELAHTPRGYEVLGANGPELRYLSAGTSILTHAQSKAAMVMNGGKLPGYAKGTGAEVKDFVKDGLDKADDALDAAMDLVGKGISEIWDWIKNKFGVTKAINALDTQWLTRERGKGATDMDGKAVSALLKKFVDQYQDTLDSASTSPAATGSHEHWMKQAGIPASWFSAINYIVSHESGWRVNATNASSGAYGLPQSWPGSKMAAAGRDWRTNPITQLKWMKSYVTERYGGAPQAAAYWRTHRNYANGGWADKFSIFGEVPGEPEVAINPKRDTSEEHIAEAIEARAKVNPNGFAGNLSKLINTAKQSAQQLVPVFASGQRVQNARQVAEARSANIDGNINLTMNIDGKQLSRIIYPTMKAMRSHEVIINGAGGAIPVGNAQPLGGVYH